MLCIVVMFDSGSVCLMLVWWFWVCSCLFVSVVGLR